MSSTGNERSSRSEAPSVESGASGDGSVVDGAPAGVHSHVSVGEQSWHMVEAGSGPVVLLAAGFPQSWYAWRLVMPILAQTHRVIALDLPGQGDSGPSFQGYDTWTVAQAVTELADHLGIDRFAFIGHDVGAWVGFSLAYRHPERLSALGLVDGNIPGINLELNAEKNWGAWHFVFNRVPDLPEALLAGRERVLIEWFFERSAADAEATFTPEDVDEYVRAFARPTTLRGHLGYYRAVPENEQRNRELMQCQISAPTLVLTGDRSGSRQLLDRLRPVAPELSGISFSETGHYVPEERPDETAEAIRRFLLATFE